MYADLLKLKKNEDENVLPLSLQCLDSTRMNKCKYMSMIKMFALSIYIYKINGNNVSHDFYTVLFGFYLH